MRKRSAHGTKGLTRRQVLKAAAGMVTGALVAALSSTKNTSLSDVNDGVSAINEPVLDAALRTRRILVLAEELLGAVRRHGKSLPVGFQALGGGRREVHRPGDVSLAVFFRRARVEDAHSGLREHVGQFGRFDQQTGVGVV